MIIYVTFPLNGKILLSDKKQPGLRTRTRMSSLNICRKTDFLECHVAVFLWKMFLPVFLVFGVPGNILSVVVLSRKRMRNTTTSVYLRILAIVDTTVLLISVPRQMLYYYASIKVTNLSNFSCKFYPYLTPSCIALSWCLLPVITLDRFIHVRYPIWAKEHCTRKSAVVVFLVLTLTILAINFHRAAFYSIQEVGVSPNSTKVSVICGPTSEWYGQFRDKIWPVIFTSLFSVTPVACQLVCNVLLVRQLTVRSRQNKARKSLEAGHKREQRDLKSVTRMLLVVCVFFTLSSVPQCTQLISKRYLFDTDIPHDVAKELLFQCIVQILMYSNNSINFLLYTVSGRMFRRELWYMLQHARHPVLKWLGRSVHPMETTYDRELQEGTSKGKRIGQYSAETKTTEQRRY